LALLPSVHHCNPTTLSSIQAQRTLLSNNNNSYNLTFFLFFSSDLWIADSKCTKGCSSVPTFDPTTSSTFQNQSTPFNITYGSGSASGSLGQDVVQMAGYSVSNQMFAVCNQVSKDLLTEPVSGLLGLGFQTIAASKAMPLWQNLVSGGAWDSPLMSFHLSRLVDFYVVVCLFFWLTPSHPLSSVLSYINSTNTPAEVPGGSFSMGKNRYISIVKFLNIF
jgi:hypothetical protein